MYRGGAPVYSTINQAPPVTPGHLLTPGISASPGSAQPALGTITGGVISSSAAYRYYSPYAGQDSSPFTPGASSTVVTSAPLLPGASTTAVTSAPAPALLPQYVIAGADNSTPAQQQHHHQLSYQRPGDVFSAPEGNSSNLGHPHRDLGHKPVPNPVGVTKGCELVFHEELQLLVRSKDRTEKSQLLTVSLGERVILPCHTRELVLQVTDSLDPFFYYSLRLTEEDFQNLKSSQGLLVDFAAFPSMVVQLLEKCRVEGATENATPRFVLVLNCSGCGGHQACLEFTELNLFKHLCHLSLIVIKASDTQLKEYLVDCIKNLKTDLDTNSSQLQLARDQLASHQRQLQETSRQLEAAVHQEQDTSSNLSQQLVQAVQQEKERASQALAELQERFERERRELEQRHLRTVEQLENRVASLDVQNRDLLETRYQGEASTRELRSRLAAREEETARITAQLTALRREKSQMEAGQSEEARRVIQLEKKVASLEEEARDRNRELSRALELSRQAQEDKARLEQDLADKKSTVSRRETAVRNVTEELLKANEIIRKLQEQLRQEQGKVKLRGKIAAEQEKLLGDKEKELTDIRDQLKQAVEEKMRLADGLRELEAGMAEREEKVEQLKHLNSTNENVINWLNKQLTAYKTTEANLGKPGGERGRGGVGGRGKSGPLGRRSTSDADTLKNKENEPLVGLDPKYFEHSTPGGTVTRQQIPDVTSLPSNVRRGGGGRPTAPDILSRPANGGIVRRTLDSVADIVT